MSKEKCLVDFKLDSDGGKYFFGKHYDLKEAKKLYKEEEYDDEKVLEIVHCYVHFGIVWIDGEKQHGFSIHNFKPKSMRGYKEATELLFKRDKQLIEHIKGLK